MKEKGEGSIIVIVVIVLVVWGLFSLFHKGPDRDSDYYSTSTSDSKYCEEPENPYDEGTGHYAGFEWAQEKDVDSCGGNSDSFIEGCEEYLSQVEAYNYCED